MKIILATPMYPPEIAEPAPYVKEVSKHLADSHEVTIVAYASTSEKMPSTNLVTVDKKKPLPIRLIKYGVTLFRASRGADIIYVQSGTAAGLPAVIVGRLRQIPVLLRFNEDEAWERATQNGLTEKNLEDFLETPEVNFYIRIIMWVQKLTLQLASAIVTTSQYQRDILISTYGICSTPIITVYNPAPKQEILPFPETKKPHQISVTTKLTVWSGVDTIVRAVSILIKDFPDIHLIVAGEGPQKKELQELVSELNLEKIVEIIGRVSRAEDWYIRKTSEVYVESPLMAGSLDKISWSFSVGTPIIASNIPVHREGIESNISGILVETGNVMGLASAIAKILNDKDFATTLTNGGTKILKEKFSWEAHIDGLNKIFNEIKTNEAK